MDTGKMIRYGTLSRLAYVYFAGTIDVAGHPRLSVHAGTLPCASHEAEVKTNALLLLRPRV